MLDIPKAAMSDRRCAFGAVERVRFAFENLKSVASRSHVCTNRTITGFVESKCAGSSRLFLYLLTNCSKKQVWGLLEVLTQVAVVEKVHLEVISSCQ